MKILLIAVNAKYIHSNLAVYSLREYAKKYRDNIELAEFTINHTVEDILKGIYMKNADVAAFSCYIWNIEIISRVTAELKKVRPGIKIWYGGPEVSYDAPECLKANKAVDGIVIGEGEQTFLELAGYYVNHEKTLQEIAGIAFKASAGYQGSPEDKRSDRENITVIPARQQLSLDSLPFPYQTLEDFQNKIIYYESSRGCPFSCSYCLSSIDRQVRLRNTESVKKELQIFLDHKVSQVKFVDRTFNCNKQHALEIWRFLKEHDNGVTNFHFEIAADLLDEEEIELLNGLRPGQIQLEIGVQSTNPVTVSAIHRKMDFKKVSENVGRIRSGHNIHQHLDLIAGLPLEDYDSFLNSFNDVYRLGPDQLQLGFLKVLKGSLMEEETKRYGIIRQGFTPYEVLKTDSLDYPQLLSLKGICKMTEIYYNSRQFENSIRFLEHFFDSPAKLYEELSLFYERTGQDLAAHSRIRRYEILLDFYQKKAEGLFKEEDKKAYVQVFKEILVLDLYIREDLKSRPPFAGEPVKYKDIREGLEAAGLDKDSTHIEHFRYDVFTGAATGQIVKKDLLAAFDYGKRDPLSRSAAVIILDWRETLDENYKKGTGTDEPHLRCTEPGIRRGI